MVGGLLKSHLLSVYEAAMLNYLRSSSNYSRLNKTCYNQSGICHICHVKLNCTGWQLWICTFLGDTYGPEAVPVIKQAH